MKFPVEGCAPLPVFNNKEWQTFKPGLGRVASVLSNLGHPERKFRHVVVGGTNGKGTVSLNLATHLPGKCGLFLSPHVMNIRERITVDGEWAPDGMWRDAYAEIQASCGDVALSYFEWLTVISVLVFRECKVDFAVFEVGLGGRHDSVNALDPELSVLTNVSLDHCEILGDSVEAIALEKIEIGRGNRTFVCPQNLLDEPYFAARLKEIGAKGVGVQVEDKQPFKANFALSEACLNVLGFTNKPKPFLLPPGRREFIEAFEGIYLDGSHNEAGWSATRSWIREKTKRPINLLCSLSKGRDPRIFLEKMRGVTKKAHVCAVGFEKELGLGHWPPEVVRLDESELENLLTEPLLVCGSLYFVGAFRQWLALQRPLPPYSTAEI